MVSWTHLSVTLYIHCLSCCKCNHLQQQSWLACCKKWGTSLTTKVTILLTKNYWSNKTLLFFLQSYYMVCKFFLVWAIPRKVGKISNLQRWWGPTIRNKSHKMSHSAKLRFMQNYVHSYMFLFISLNHYNIAFIILIHVVFIYLFIYLFLAAETKIMAYSELRFKQAEKHWFTLASYSRHSQSLCTSSCTILSLLADCASNLSCQCMIVLPSIGCVCVFIEYILLICVPQRWTTRNVTLELHGLSAI